MHEGPVKSGPLPDALRLGELSRSSRPGVARVIPASHTGIRISPESQRGTAARAREIPEARFTRKEAAASERAKATVETSLARSAAMASAPRRPSRQAGQHSA